MQSTNLTKPSCRHPGRSIETGRPQTSGILARSEAITGQPIAIASSGGRPKPSVKDGKTRQRLSFNKAVIALFEIRPSQMTLSEVVHSATESRRSTETSEGVAIYGAHNSELQAEPPEFPSKGQHKRHVFVRRWTSNHDDRIRSGGLLCHFGMLRRAPVRVLMTIWNHGNIVTRDTKGLKLGLRECRHGRDFSRPASPMLAEGVGRANESASSSFQEKGECLHHECTRSVLTPLAGLCSQDLKGFP